LPALPEQFWPGVSLARLITYPSESRQWNQRGTTGTGWPLRVTAAREANFS